jgi:hydrogenase expression/formation protein HypE
MHGRLPTGKVPWDLVAKSLEIRLPPAVVLGPGAGEDAALVTIGGELWAVATDPISLAAADAGRLAVTVNANDVAVRGGTPRFFLVVLMLAPDEATEDLVDGILRQVRSACDAIDVALIGGHTEVTEGLSRSLVVGTMLGRVAARPITTGGLRLGDLVGLTKWVGLEGTSILLSEFGPRLRAAHPVDTFARCQELLDGDWLSVIPEAAVAAANSAVTAMHDVTEGGIGEALYEMERASGLGIEVDVEELPILPETRLICDDLGMDPMGLIGSGSLLFGCSPEGRHGLEADLTDAGIRFAWIGRAVAERGPVPKSVPRFERDEILKALSARGIEAVVFDMDGTLIDSSAVGCDRAFDHRRVERSARSGSGVEVAGVEIHRAPGDPRGRAQGRRDGAAGNPPGARPGNGPGDQQLGRQHSTPAGPLRPRLRGGADPRLGVVEAVRGSDRGGRPSARCRAELCSRGGRLAVRPRRRA